MDKRVQEGCGKSTGTDAVNGQKSIYCVRCQCAVCVKGIFHGIFIQDIWLGFKSATPHILRYLRSSFPLLHQMPADSGPLIIHMLGRP